MAWLELSIFTICVLNTFGEFFLDQYISTKESWMADYCKQDKEVDPTPSEDWMGSSVDPPCFGQSKIFLYTCVTKSPLTPIAMFQWEIKIEPSFSMENLQEVLTAFYSCFSLWKGLFIFWHNTLNFSSQLSFHHCGRRRTRLAPFLNSGHVAHKLGHLEMHWGGRWSVCVLLSRTV